MILFKPEHIEPINKSIKTETRRLGKKRWNVGAIHQFWTRLFDKKSHFNSGLILAVFEQPLGEMTEEDAYNEGGYTLEEYKDVWNKINPKNTWGPCVVVWVVKFEVNYER